MNNFLSRKKILLNLDPELANLFFCEIYGGSGFIIFWRWLNSPLAASCNASAPTQVGLALLRFRARKSSGNALIGLKVKSSGAETFSISSRPSPRGEQLSPSDPECAEDAEPFVAHSSSLAFCPASLRHSSFTTNVYRRLCHEPVNEFSRCWFRSRW